jgi:hypothetical protein
VQEQSGHGVTMGRAVHNQLAGTGEPQKWSETHKNHTPFLHALCNFCAAKAA